MKLPEYITREEVQRVCKELGLRDWTKLREAKIDIEEARIVQREIGAEAAQLSDEDFRQGLEVELEHGLQYSDADVTKNHPILTGKIVLAHLKEMLDYYYRLEVAELGGDLLQAAKSGDAEKLAREYRKWLKAKKALSIKELELLGD